MTHEADFRFSAPDRRRAWLRLALTMSQAAALTGVSERQIQHWMDRGYLARALDGGRKVSGDNLDMIMLIRQARDAGVPLRRAVKMADEYLTQEALQAMDSEVAPAALRDLEQQLNIVRHGIDAVSGLLRRVAPTDGAAPGQMLNQPRWDRVSSQGKQQQ